VSCISLFGLCIVCPSSIYGLWFPFDICKLFFHQIIYANIYSNVSTRISTSAWVASQSQVLKHQEQESLAMAWLFNRNPGGILTCLPRYTDSDYPFGIFKLFFCLSFCFISIRFFNCFDSMVFISSFYFPLLCMYLSLLN
jgi:hypothetical protein